MQINKFLWIIPIIIQVNCASETKLSPMQKRHITSRVYDSDYETVYRATLTVLQDQGYIIKNTDMNSGLIVATVDRESSGLSQFLQELFTEHIHDKGTLIEISCMADKISENSTELRINIQETKYASGGFKKDVDRIYDEEVYQQIFNEIAVEVKRREAIRGELLNP